MDHARPQKRLEQPCDRRTLDNDATAGRVYFLFRPGALGVCVCARARACLCVCMCVSRSIAIIDASEREVSGIGVFGFTLLRLDGACMH